MLLLIAMALAPAGCSLFGVFRGDPAPRGGEYDRIYRMGSPQKMVAWGMSAPRIDSVTSVIIVLSEVMTDQRFTPAEQRQAAEGAFTVLERLLRNEPAISPDVGRSSMGAWRTHMYLVVLDLAAPPPKWASNPSVRDLYERLEPLDRSSIVYAYWQRKPAEFESWRMSEEMWKWNDSIRDTIDMGNVALRGETMEQQDRSR
jgi:hypothetical protein